MSSTPERSANSSTPSKDRRGAEHGGDEGGRHHRGEQPQGGDVVGRRLRGRTVAHLVVDDEEPERFAAGGAEFVLVNPAEKLALVELGGAVEVAAQFRPADIEQADLHPRARLDAVDQPVDAAPGGLQALQPGGVQDGVELVGDQRIEGGDVAVEAGEDIVGAAPPQEAPVRGAPAGQGFLRRGDEEPGERLCGGATGNAEEPARQHRLAQART